LNIIEPSKSGNGQLNV